MVHIKCNTWYIRYFVRSTCVTYVRSTFLLYLRTSTYLPPLLLKTDVLRVSGTQTTELNVYTSINREGKSVQLYPGMRYARTTGRFFESSRRARLLEKNVYTGTYSAYR